jgi:hypothetical protein
VIVGVGVTTRVVEAVRVPTIVVAVMIVHPDGPRLAISSRLGPAAMLRWIECERGKQQQQHGGYCDVPVCSRVFKHQSYR